MGISEKWLLKQTYMVLPLKANVCDLQSWSVIDPDCGPKVNFSPIIAKKVAFTWLPVHQLKAVETRL